MLTRMVRNAIDSMEMSTDFYLKRNLKKIISESILSWPDENFIGVIGMSISS